MTIDYAIIPVREFANSKLRLKDVISTDQRIALAGALLQRVSIAISLSNMTRALIVASNPEEAKSRIGPISKISLVEERIHHGGVNSAMQQGIERAKDEGAETITLVPSDLPFINSAKINSVLEALQRYELIINGSERKDGTNLLSMHSSLEFILHFDDNSYVMHTREAAEQELNFLTLNYDEFALDLDDYNDLNMAMRLYGTDSLGTFLQKVSESGI